MAGESTLARSSSPCRAPRRRALAALRHPRPRRGAATARACAAGRPGWGRRLQLREKTCRSTYLAARAPLAACREAGPLHRQRPRAPRPRRGRTAARGPGRSPGPRARRLLRPGMLLGVSTARPGAGRRAPGTAPTTSRWAACSRPRPSRVPARRPDLIRRVRPNPVAARRHRGHHRGQCAAPRGRRRAGGHLGRCAPRRTPRRRRSFLARTIAPARRPAGPWCAGLPARLGRGWPSSPSARAHRRVPELGRRVNWSPTSRARARVRAAPDGRGDVPSATHPAHLAELLELRGRAASTRGAITCANMLCMAPTRSCSTCRAAPARGGRARGPQDGAPTPAAGVGGHLRGTPLRPASSARRVGRLDHRAARRSKRLLLPRRRS